MIVVGSGPGGASVARDLARAGKRVLILERGRDYRRRARYGTYLGPLTYADRHSLLFTEEGLNIIRPLMVGGATNMFCGAAAYPPEWLASRYGIELRTYAEQIAAELGIAPLPPELRGAASTRIAEAAMSLGYRWDPLPKFVNPARSQRFRCGARCMLGCRCGAKWNAAEWLDDAVAHGALLLTDALVEEVLIENRKATGVIARWRGRKVRVDGKIVVLCAGGIGTPILLQRAGFFEAGHGMTMDTTVMVYGISKEKGNGDEPPMTWSYADDEVGYMLSPLIDPWLLYPIIALLKGPWYPLRWPWWKNTLGIMIKIKDDISGGITFEGKISKPLTERDRFRLNHGAIVARRILVRAGADPDSIFLTPLRGTHPSGTVRIGQLVDPNLQTVANLYVCDASVFPEALGRPTVLTILSLGRRLAEHLLASGRL